MKTVASDLAKEIQPDIKKFILDNANVAANLESSSPTDGAKSISEAIAYGVCKALTSQTFSDLFGDACRSPEPVPPSPVTAGNPTLGTTIFNAWKAKATES